MDYKQALETFRELDRKIGLLEGARDIVNWDLRVMAPPACEIGRSAILGKLASDSFHLLVGDEMGGALAVLGEAMQEGKLGHVDASCVRHYLREHGRMKKIPSQLYEAYRKLQSESESTWQRAKRTNDFPLWAPYLKRLIDMTNQMIDHWGYEGHRYNALLSYQEPGLTVERLEGYYATMRQRIVPLLRDIRKQEEIDDSFLSTPISVEDQRRLCLFLLDAMGFDMNRGVLAESEHPYTMSVTPQDVRLTTHFRMDNVTKSLFSTLHEMGHGMYEQNPAKELYGTAVCGGLNGGMHESSSRFWENLVGRSRPFWRWLIGNAEAPLPAHLRALDPEQVYRGINKVRFSTQRMQADEACYSLHIVMRYELERAMMDGDLPVEELPRAFAAKQREYLDVEPKTDAEGVLQDIQWSMSMCSFQSYALGNMYNAQYYKTLREEMPDFDQVVERGDFRKILGWMTEKIYRHGRTVEPAGLIADITGREPCADDLCAYLEGKFGDIYGL